MAQKGTSHLLTLDDMTVVDADAHTMESDKQLLPYIKDNNPAVARLLEGTNMYSNYVRTSAGASPSPESGGYNNLRTTGHDQMYSLESKLEEMQDIGIDIGVITPTLLNAINTTNHPEIGFAYTRAYNHWIEDEFLGQHDGIYNTVLVSRHKPDKSAEEIDRLADEKHIVGVAFPNGGLIPPLGANDYDPIYQAAVDNDLPLVVHGNVRTFSWTFPTQYQNIYSTPEDTILNHPFAMMWTVSSAIFKGLPERFPDIKIVCQEAGVAWIPYLVWRMDDYYLTMADAIPWMSKKPSEYIAENFYFTSQPVGHTASDWAGNDHLAMAVEMANPDQLMFSADLPHGAFDEPSELFDRIAPHFDEETLRSIMGEKAIEVFGLN